jgi:hypothetical protein
MPKDNHLLLVEGPDDAHVFYHLSTHYQLQDKFIIKSKEGYENLRDSLPSELKGRSDLERLGIVVDADADLDARWMALRNILRASGATNLPKKPDPTGTIIDVQRPDRTLVVGVWIMPNNQLPGMLEDFISFLVPTQDSLWNRAGDCVRQIPEQDRRFPLVQQTKAHLHTWLAWQEEPGKPMGQAITKRYLNANAPYAQHLINWLRCLFEF